MDNREMLDFLRAEFPNAGIAAASVAKDGEKTTITFRVARPGIVIGRAGANIIALKNKLEQMLGTVNIDVREIRKPELEPILVADRILAMLEQGVALERALDLPAKQSIRAGARGIRIRLSGKLNHEVIVGDFAEGAPSATVSAHDVTVEVSISSKAPEDDSL